MFSDSVIMARRSMGMNDAKIPTSFYARNEGGYEHCMLEMIDGLSMTLYYTYPRAIPQTFRNRRGETRGYKIVLSGSVLSGRYILLTSDGTPDLVLI